MICQAVELDRALRTVLDDIVDSCEEIGAVDHKGYLLCEGCTEAFEALLALGEASLRRRGDELLRSVFKE